MSNIELDLLTIKIGYFLVKNVGILFLSKRTIVMAEQESLNCIYQRIGKDRDF